MRCDPHQIFALGYRLSHPLEVGVLQIAEPAVYCLEAVCRSGGGKIALFYERHGETPLGGVPGDPRTVNTSTDYAEVKLLIT